MAKKKSVNKAKAVKAVIDGQELLGFWKAEKKSQSTRKDYQANLDKSLQNVITTTSIALSVIGEPVRVIYQAPGTTVKLVGKVGKIVSLVIDGDGNRVYDVKFREKGISSTKKVSDVRFTFSETDIEFINEEKFEALNTQLLQSITH